MQVPESPPHSDLLHPTGIVSSCLIVSILINVSVGFVTVHGATVYRSDDEPSALEEQIRWYLNRGRFSSVEENQTWDTVYSDIAVSAPPLAPHHTITLAARHHSEDMGANDLFQHDTIPGSSYYNSSTESSPWKRMEHEGYPGSGVSENIAAGYGSATSAYLGWWNSTGHRTGMFKTSAREIGIGYAYESNSQYRRYYTMDLGRQNNVHFLTGTLFSDGNEDGVYGQDEGLADIQLTLSVDGNEEDMADISSSCGSFAIPIQQIADGAVVTLSLHNLSNQEKSLSIPKNYHAYTKVVLGPGEKTSFGTFSQPEGVLNVGLRDITPITAAEPPCTLELAREGNGLRLRWVSQSHRQYLLQGSTDCIHWEDVSDAFNGNDGWLDLGLETVMPPGSDYRFYRVQVVTP